LNEKNVLNNTIIRTTLKIIEEQVAPFTNIMRCHRTAIANIGFLNTLNGTAQGYKLQLKYGIEEIPVSRSLNKELKAKIAAL
jgi:DNA-binding LytR/AlgR family response regulator